MLPCLPLSLLAGCATDFRELAAPSADNYEQFYPVGVPDDVRVFADFEEIHTSKFVSDLRDGLTKRKKSTGLNILALSGGAQDGAYGAGVLNGWSEKGTRPEFDVVTGISTGALIAPFAFLGPDYDGALERFYTTTDTERVADLTVMTALFGGGALATSEPLAHTIEMELKDDVLRAIATEHRKGRRLLVGTTNLDAERPVIWDIGYIATIGTPNAYRLIRKVILASASIPVVFNPIAIKVTDGTVRREELHVDGGLTQHIFTYPRKFDMREVIAALGLSKKQNTVWLVYNKRLEPKYEAQKTDIDLIAERTVSTMLRTRALGDVNVIISLAKRDGLRVNALPIPGDFKAQSDDWFDPAYMRQLFHRGYHDG